MVRHVEFPRYDVKAIVAQSISSHLGLLKSSSRQHHRHRGPRQRFARREADSSGSSRNQSNGISVLHLPPAFDERRRYWIRIPVAVGRSGVGGACPVKAVTPTL